MPKSYRVHAPLPDISLHGIFAWILGIFWGYLGDIYNKKFLSLAWFIKKQYPCALFRDKPERVNKFN